MRKIWTLVVPLIAASVAGLVAIAAQPDWSVSQMSGKVAITVNGAQPISLTKGALLPAGGILTTGPASRATLVREEQTMVVGANSAVAIPAGKSNPQFTTVLESAGLVSFTVDKQKVQHFAVETPYLAALVKGTEFTVNITRADGTVSVDRGIVEVTSLKTGYMVDITAGQTATVKADGTLLVGGPGAPAVALQGTPHQPLVSFGIPDATNTLGLGGSLGIGGNGLSAGVDAGIASVQANLGSGGVNAGASVGGADVGVSANGSGISVDAGPASVSVGSGGVDVGLGDIHIGLGP